MTLIRMKKLSLGVLLIAAAWFLDGCYYMQAIGGQMEVLRDRQPIEEVIADDETDDALKAKLELVSDARQYAVDELLLPENDSYSSYRDLVKLNFNRSCKVICTRAACNF